MDTSPQFSATAIGVCLVMVIVCCTVLIRKYPDGLDGPTEMPRFSRLFMVTSALFGTSMATLMTLTLCGEITFPNI